MPAIRMPGTPLCALRRVLSLLWLLLDLMVQGKELNLLLSGEKRRSLMVVVPDFFRFASLVRPGILSSASLLKSLLLLLSFFLLLECLLSRLMEEWR